MRILIQRVSRASVTIDGAIHSSSGAGMLVLLGITHDDTPEDVEWLASKAAKLRIFDDERGVMNLDIMQAGGETMVVSQFTLYGATRKGNRPSYVNAAPEAIAVPLYELFTRRLSELTGRQAKTGVFGADMKVELFNDGPVTIWIDSKNRE